MFCDIWNDRDSHVNNEISGAFYMLLLLKQFQRNRRNRKKKLKIEWKFIRLIDEPTIYSNLNSSTSSTFAAFTYAIIAFIHPHVHPVFHGSFNMFNRFEEKCIKTDNKCSHPHLQRSHEETEQKKNRKQKNMLLICWAHKTIERRNSFCSLQLVFRFLFFPFYFICLLFTNGNERKRRRISRELLVDLFHRIRMEFIYAVAVSLSAERWEMFPFPIETFFFRFQEGISTECSVFLLFVPLSPSLRLFGSDYPLTVLCMSINRKNIISRFVLYLFYCLYFICMNVLQQQHLYRR